MKKLIWKGTLKQMRNHPCYRYAINEVEKIITEMLCVRCGINSSDCENKILEASKLKAKLKQDGFVL